MFIYLRIDAFRITRFFRHLTQLDVPKPIETIGKVSTTTNLWILIHSIDVLSIPSRNFGYHQCCNLRVCHSVVPVPFAVIREPFPWLATSIPSVRNSVFLSRYTAILWSTPALMPARWIGAAFVQIGILPGEEVPPSRGMGHLPFCCAMQVSRSSDSNNRAQSKRGRT
jgi:hypothetical protein